MSFRVIGIGNKIAGNVRKTLRSPQYGHQAFVDVATGYGPCRSCLRTFETNKDKRILFTYNSFEGLSDLPLPSPIYIHDEICENFNSSEFPAELRKLPMLFEGFAKESELVIRKEVDSKTIEKQIKEIFNNKSVKYINIRNSEAGCFIARIEKN